MFDSAYVSGVLRQPPAALATITGGPGHQGLRGKVTFHRAKGGVLLTAQIEGLPQGAEPCSSNIFGFHIHEGNACTGNSEDPFANAGPHYNPGNCPHPAHAGDLPPLFGNNGFAFLTFFTDRFSIKEVLGRAVIIHAHPDNFTSQPAGDSGGKIACGIIQQGPGYTPRCFPHK